MVEATPQTVCTNWKLLICSSKVVLPVGWNLSCDFQKVYLHLTKCEVCFDSSCVGRKRGACNYESCELFSGGSGGRDVCASFRLLRLRYLWFLCVTRYFGNLGYLLATQHLLIEIRFYLPYQYDQDYGLLDVTLWRLVISYSRVGVAYCPHFQSGPGIINPRQQLTLRGLYEAWRQQ